MTVNSDFLSFVNALFKSEDHVTDTVLCRRCSPVLITLVVVYGFREAVGEVVGSVLLKRIEAILAVYFFYCVLLATVVSNNVAL